MIGIIKGNKQDMGKTKLLWYATAQKREKDQSLYTGRRQRPLTRHPLAPENQVRH